MIYKAIGIMSGSSLDGMDIVYAHLQETGGKWTYEIIHADCYHYPVEWTQKLRDATSLSALDYQLLHTAYGHYTGDQVNRFIDAFSLYHKVDLVASHGHTTFHVPEKRMTGQLGDGAAIAAVTGLPVVSDLRAMDIALGGQGAPIVPIGEKLLFHEYDLLLNLGGIANLSAKIAEDYIAFDICAANRVLNMLVASMDREYDDDGNIAAGGQLNEALLHELDALEFYGKGYPKSLANNFGTDIVFPLVSKQALSMPDALRTYVEHIAIQVKKSISGVFRDKNIQSIPGNNHRLLITGGGALNAFMVGRLQDLLKDINVEPVVPETNLVNFKEALIMALMGVLRWREEYTVLASVTGATRNSIGGALWLGVEA